MLPLKDENAGLFVIEAFNVSWYELILWKPLVKLSVVGVTKVLGESAHLVRSMPSSSSSGSSSLRLSWFVMIERPF